MNNSTPVSLTVAPTAREVIEKAGPNALTAKFHCVQEGAKYFWSQESLDLLLAEAYRQWTAEGKPASRGTAGGDIESPIPDLESVVRFLAQEITTAPRDREVMILVAGVWRKAHYQELWDWGWVDAFDSHRFLSHLVTHWAEVADMVPNSQPAPPEQPGTVAPVSQGEAPNPKVQEEWEEIDCPSCEGTGRGVRGGPTRGPVCYICLGKRKLYRRLNTSKERQA